MSEVSGHKSHVKRVDDPADVPDVGFVGRNKQTRRRENRPLSEAIFDRAPYSSQRKDKRLSLQLNHSGSSSDEDERTNIAAASKRGGTFAVGLAARNKELKDVGDSETDHEETCEYCAAEKVNRACVICEGAYHLSEVAIPRTVSGQTYPIILE